MKRVVVGLSGGVDSSVAAYILKEQGYEVIGLFMKNWHDDSVTISNECPWLEDSNDALLVAEKLGIPFQTVDLSEQYKEKIVDYMFGEYERGRTPNPDVLCNREDGQEIFQLLAGKDTNKDQSYFLCQLSQEQLAKALFPIGELTKPEVRELAAKLDLITAEKKDSQGLCFIGKVRLPEFLQQKLQPKEGIIVEIPEDAAIYTAEKPIFSTEEAAFAHEAQRINYLKVPGKVVGKHQGAHYFTKGQRKGLNVGGTKEPLFIIETDVERNIIYTGQGNQHPGLFKKALFISNEEVHWIREDLALKPGEKREVMARIRYRQPLQKATLHQYKSGMYVVFENPQSAITEGQFVAWQEDDEVIGSGVIA
jgi:tRNA-specific 2-thiouridylase